jgi:AcrR family transcriptional regulator
MARTTKEEAARTRARLIASAAQIVAAHGPAALTLDAVGAEAGVSKGGVLHHFGSKEALIEAVLRALFDEFEACINRFAEADSRPAGRWLRAYVHATFDDEAPAMEVSAALLVQIVQSAALLSLVRAENDRWQTRLESDGLPPARAAVIRLAADAWWTNRLLIGATDDDSLRPALRDELLRLIESALPAPTAEENA